MLVGRRGEANTGCLRAGAGIGQTRASATEGEEERNGQVAVTERKPAARIGTEPGHTTWYVQSGEVEWQGSVMGRQ